MCTPEMIFFHNLLFTKFLFHLTGLNRKVVSGRNNSSNSTKLILFGPLFKFSIRVTAIDERNCLLIDSIDIDSIDRQS